MVSYSTLRGIDAHVMEIQVGEKSRIAGKRLKKVKIPEGTIIGTITRGKDVFVPTGESQILPGDKLIVFSLPSAISLVEKLFS